MIPFEPQGGLIDNESPSSNFDLDKKHFGSTRMEEGLLPLWFSLLWKHHYPGRDVELKVNKPLKVNGYTLRMYFEAVMTKKFGYE